MHFEPTITLDAIVQVAVFVGGGLWAFFKLRGDVDKLALRVTGVEKLTGTIGDAITAIAVQENRILNVENDIRDLQRGEGYITAHGRG